MKYNSQQKREAMLVCFSVVLLVVNTIWKNGNLLLFHKGL